MHSDSGASVSVSVLCCAALCCAVLCCAVPPKSIHHSFSSLISHTQILTPPHPSPSGYSVSIGSRGIGFSFAGYSTPLPALIATIIAEFSSPTFWSSIDHSLVDLCKERLIRSLKSFPKERPDNQCDSLLSYVMQEHSWLPEERLRAAEEITGGMLVDRVVGSFQGTKKVGGVGWGEWCR